MQSIVATRSFLSIPCVATLLFLLTGSPASAAPQDSKPLIEPPKVEPPKVEVKPIEVPEVKLPDAKVPSRMAVEGGSPAPTQSAPRDSDVILAEEDDGAIKLPRELKPSASRVKRRRGADEPSPIEQILDAPISAATRRTQGALAAPAYTVVLTRADLRARGYTDLSQIFDDLAGMDTVRPGAGESYVKGYVRGYRSVGADPYLVLLDGMAMNDLFYRNGQIIATFPITSIDHVEIVYGPSATLYGSHGSMAVINVVTIDGRSGKEEPQHGVTLSSRIVFGGPQGNWPVFADMTKIADATAMYVGRDMRLRLSLRLEDSVLDRSIGQYSQFPYSQDQTYSSPIIWPKVFLDEFANLAGSANGRDVGQFRSPDRKAAVDARLFLGKSTEVGAGFFLLSAGAGTAFPADRQQAGGTWTQSEFAAFARHTAKLSPYVTSMTAIQFRDSGVVSPTSYMTRESTGNTHFIMVRSLGADHMGATISQDLDILALRNFLSAKDELTLGTGVLLRYVANGVGDERGYRQEGLVSTSSFEDGRALGDGNMNELTSHGSSVLPPTTGIAEAAAYLLATYRFFDVNTMHLGLRVDHDSLRTEPNLVLRTGYVGRPVRWLNMKLLYGQGILAPGVHDRWYSVSPNAVMATEVSHTGEFLADVLFDAFTLHVGAFAIRASNPIVETPNSDPQPGWQEADQTFRASPKTLLTLDSRTLAGLDLGGQIVFGPLRVWGHYSRQLVAEDACGSAEVTGCKDGKRPVGDIAFDKAWAGLSVNRAPISLTAQVRVVGKRMLVADNPLGTIDPYATLDGNFVVSDVPVKGLSLGFRMTNIIGTRYTEPGIRLADSGANPTDASRPADNTSNNFGSSGFYNSLLVQPGRGFYFTLGVDIDATATPASNR